MRTHWFAAVAAITLASCNGDPALVSERRLFGGWEGEAQPYTVAIAGQTRTIQGHVELSLFPNATYHRDLVLFDPVLNREFVERAEEGTYSTSGTLLDLKLHALYNRNGGEPQAAPALEPFDGEGRFGFSLAANVLTVNWCAMGEYCVRDFTTRHVRVTA
jgi:hypothetical protein